MGNDKNWVDYANLGSNLYQNVQLGGLQQKLGAMAALAASERAVAGLEDERREIVFKANVVLSEMRASAAENRGGVLALATQTLMNFKSSGIGTAGFRAYEDKERVAALIKAYEELADECASTLSPAERTEAELSAQYLVEQSVLNQYIGLRQKQEELKEAESQLRLLQSKSGPFAVVIGVGLLGFLGGVALAIWADSEKLAQFIGFSGMATMLVGVLLWGFLPQRRRGNAQRRKVAKLRLDLNLEEISDPLLLARGDKFDSKSSSELKAVQAQREALVGRVLRTASASRTGD